MWEAFSDILKSTNVTTAVPTTLRNRIHTRLRRALEVFIPIFTFTHALFLHFCKHQSFVNIIINMSHFNQLPQMSLVNHYSTCKLKLKRISCLKKKFKSTYSRSAHYHPQHSAVQQQLPVDPKDSICETVTNNSATLKRNKLHTFPGLIVRYDKGFLCVFECLMNSITPPLFFLLGYFPSLSVSGGLFHPAEH